MFKTLLYLGLAGIFVVVGLVGFAYWKFRPSAEGVLRFIAENPERASISVIQDGELVIERGARRMRPLASTVKIMVAMEYAHQAAAGEIDPDELVPMADLRRFYVPRTDGGAHESFLESTAALVVDDALPLREVAKGMILFSSNACTEELAHRLGVDRINARIAALGIEDHSPYYSLVGSLFVGKERFPELEGKELAEALRGLSDEEYRAAATAAGDKLAEDPAYRATLDGVDLEVQRVWSERLPRSTTAAYAGLMARINARSFPEDVNAHLSELLEGLMANPDNQAWLEHGGTKGGSTAFVLTKASYATTKDGHSTALAIFFDDLSVSRGLALQMGMNPFELQLLSDDEFRARVVRELAEN